MAFTMILVLLIEMTLLLIVYTSLRARRKDILLQDNGSIRSRWKSNEDEDQIYTAKHTLKNEQTTDNFL